MKKTSFAFATEHVIINVQAPEGVLPIQYAAFVERKAIEIECVLKEIF